MDDQRARFCQNAAGAPFMRYFKLALAVALIFQGGVLEATERKTYAYDALGRMIAIESRSDTGTGNQAQYNFDAASNRTSVLSSGQLLNTSLNSGDHLNRGQGIVSADGAYKFVFQFDGDLALYGANDTLIWNSGTQGSAADLLVLQGDGNLVLYAGATPLWATGTTVSGSRFAVQNDGNIVIYTPTNHPIWARFGCC